MPLFKALGKDGAEPQQRRRRRKKRMKSGKTDEDGSVLPLSRLCLLSIADNMKDVWARDYADNYLDQYSFRHIMGPFNPLPRELVEELTILLCDRKQLSRAALHLLLVPQLRALSLEKCPGLVTSALCVHISARCQDLWSLNLSGAQQLPSKVLCETLGCLPALRSLSLAGTPCDRSVIREITHHCHFLRHLDVSRCHFLSPGALLCLGVGSGSTPVSKSSVSPPSCPTPPSPLLLSSLLALDIGFGEEEKDSVAAAAFLLLSLPCLERVALEGLAQACRLIEFREFDQADGLTDREGVPRLCEVWRQRQRQDIDRWSKKQEDEDGKEEEEGELWKGSGSESEEYSNRNDRPCCSRSENKNRGFSGVGCVIQGLKDVRAASCDSLESLGRLCPNIHSIFISTDDDTRGRNQGSLLVSGLQMWSDQLKRLSLYHPGPLLDLLPALHVSGSSLVFLSLEGVKNCTQNALLDIISACPSLRELLMLAEINNMPQVQVEEEEEQLDDQGLPRLPYLYSLTLRFSDEHYKMTPNMSWMQHIPHSMSYKRVLKSLLLGSPLLEKLSLVSLPCCLNCVLQEILRQLELDLRTNAASEDIAPMPFGHLRYINLQQTDVRMTAVKSLMQRSKRLECIDLSHCWQISQQEFLTCESDSKAKLIWS